MRRALPALVLLLASAAVAGDSGLFVREDPRCDLPSRHPPVLKGLTSAEVLAGLERSFTVRGHGLWGVFTNGQVQFCGAAERRAFERGLAALGSRRRLVEGRWWRDVTGSLGSPGMLDALDEALRRQGLPAAAQRRLGAAKEALAQRKAAAGR